MRHPILRAFAIGLPLALIGAALSLAAGRNLASDAVTRATTWNEHDGQIAWLADGLVPPDTTARAFAWHTKGILAFDWGQVLPIAGLRLRVGDIANDYQVRAYLGGHLLDEGASRDPQGEETARVEEFSRVVDGWQEIALPPGTTADNLELRTLGPAQFYEVEIIAADGTPVPQITWASVKTGVPVHGNR